MSITRKQIPQAIEQAIALHQAGDLAGAEALYQQVLALDPKDANALLNLSTVYTQRGADSESLRLLNRLVAAHPAIAYAHFAQGNCLRKLKRPAEAVGSYDRAIAREAKAVAFHVNRAVVLAELERIDEALESYGKALALDPNHLEALSNRATLLNSLRRHAEALVDTERLLALAPQAATTHDTRALVLSGLGRQEEALECYETAIALDPSQPALHGKRALALSALRRYDAALESYDQFIRLDPENAEARNNRATVYNGDFRFNDALEDCERAIAADPKLAMAHDTRGGALAGLGRYEEALASYDAAIAADPQFANAYWNKALLLLSLGRYAQGWEFYEWRWQTERLKLGCRRYPQPRWLGDAPIAGKTVFLYPEQGLGDFIQFSRYIPQFRALGARLVIEVPAALMPLMEASFTDPTIELKRRDPDRSPIDFTANFPFDYHLPIMSLPHAFGTTLETVPQELPYLTVPAAKQAAWAARLGPEMRPRVGLVWSGAAGHQNDHNRSIALAQLAPLLGLPYEFHSLQKEIREGDAQHLRGIISHAEALTDFADTAALADAMDVVISVDTSVAHLAGALGKKLWLLLPWIGDYRWMLDRTDSPWYPTAHLFRQPQAKDWESVVTQLMGELRATFPPTVITKPAPETIERAIALHTSGTLEEAAPLYQQLIDYDPTDLDALLNLSTLEGQRGRVDVALQLLQQLVAAHPKVAYGRFALGNLLLKAQRHAEALTQFEQAAILDPALADAHTNAATALNHLGRFAEARAACERALALKPGDARTHNTLGTASVGLREYDTARAAFDRSLTLDPGLVGAQWNKTLLLLSRGDYAEGWKLFECRWNTEHMLGKQRSIAAPLWLGDAPLAGKRVCVLHEQGFGDAIQCARYIPELAAMGATVVWEVPEPLLPLMSHSVAGEKIQVIAPGQLAGSFDYYLPVMSLPYACRTTLETIPATTAYLRVPPEKQAAWAARLGPRTTLRVGLVWSGAPAHLNDKNRSIALQQLAPLLDLPFAFHALQKDIHDRDRPHLKGLQVHSDALTDFADTAALIAAMDVVISVDTSVAHLAGALGKPVWVMLPDPPDYRWLLGRDDSPWYTSARLFRQPQAGDWKTVVNDVAEALRAYAPTAQNAAPVGAAFEPIETLFQRALAAHQANQLASAEALYHEVLSREAKHLNSLANLSSLKLAQGVLPEALLLLERALAVNQNIPSLHYNYGKILIAAKMPAEALKRYRRAIALAPETAEFYNSEGVTLFELTHYAEAVTAYNNAIARDPSSAEYYNNRANALAHLGRAEEAIADYARAVERAPDMADAHINRAFLELMRGDFENGWARHEWRWKHPRSTEDKRPVSSPLWLGHEPLAGRSIVIHSEQGSGDVIQFCRYVPMLEAMGARVILEVHAALVELMQTVSPTTTVLARGAPLPAHDFHCPIMSLPLAFHTRVETIPATIPYLAVQPEKRAAWQQRLGEKTVPRIGLAWSGSPTHTNDHNRSMMLQQFAPLFTLPYAFHSLHRDVRERDMPALAQIKDHRTLLTNFSDTAALIDTLDLVISVDTSVAHLAGALGKPVFVLLPKIPDFRWLLARDDSPWYPTARLFRQPESGDWASVVAQVKQALAAPNGLFA